MPANRVTSRNPWPIYFVLDDSGSMGGQPAADVNAAMAHTVDELVSRSGGIKPYFKVSVVKFGSSPTVLAEAESEASLQRDIGKITTFRGDSGSTDMAAALDEVGEVARRNPGAPTDFTPYVFLLTDGAADDAAAAEAAATRLKALDIPSGRPRIVVFGFGSANDELMKRIASTPELYVRLSSSKDLARVFPAIGTQVAGTQEGTKGVDQAIVDF